MRRITSKKGKVGRPRAARPPQKCAVWFCHEEAAPGKARMCNRHRMAFLRYGTPLGKNSDDCVSLLRIIDELTSAIEGLSGDVCYTTDNGVEVCACCGGSKRHTQPCSVGKAEELLERIPKMEEADVHGAEDTN